VHEHDYDDVFKSNGPLARALPGYAYRPEQAAMAKRWGWRWRGSSPWWWKPEPERARPSPISYLRSYRGAAPSSRRAHARCRINCFAAMFRCWPKPWGCRQDRPAQGRANYLCRHRLELASQQGIAAGRMSAASPVLARVVRWAATTTRAAIVRTQRFAEQSSVWPNITPPRELPWPRVPQFSRCMYSTPAQCPGGRHRGGESSLLWPIWRSRMKDSGFVAGAEAVILDEAHQIRTSPPILRPYLVGAAGANTAARHRGRADRGRVRALEITRAVNEVNEHLEELRAALQRGPGRYEWLLLPDSFLDVLPNWRRRSAESRSCSKASARAPESRTARAAPAHWPTDWRPSANIRRHRPALGGCERERPAAAVHPLEVAERLREYVESVHALGFSRPRLWRSARISRTSPRGWACPGARTLGIESPFDYRSRRGFFCRRTCPTRKVRRSPRDSSTHAHPCWRRAAAARSCCTPAIEDWRKAFARCNALSHPPFPVLVQGEAPREHC